jgi:hypothetical protein
MLTSGPSWHGEPKLPARTNPEFRNTFLRCLFRPDRLSDMSGNAWRSNLSIDKFGAE